MSGAIHTETANPFLRLRSHKRAGLLPVHKCRSRNAIVFVHGFKSNAFDTWAKPSDAEFWPERLGRDLEKNVFCFQYDNNAFRGTKRAPLLLVDIADELSFALSSLEVDRLHLVCHSFGGLVGKALVAYKSLRDPMQRAVGDRLFGLTVFGCPNYGHWMAPIQNSLLFGGRLSAPNTKALFLKSRNLIGLQSDFLRAEARMPNLAVQSIVENGYTYGLFRVYPDDAKALGGEIHVSPENHFGLCKSLSSDSAEYLWLTDFVVRRFAAHDRTAIY